ncbi:glycosyltransferase family 4 protein [Brachybacterium alimentarium]|uniref:glycosyltransferase family 4 protein n=1 Tax=Brachybacterium alimentarium TaxID=47845 RepID=UPI003FD569A6
MRIAYILLDPGIGVFGTKGASVHVQEVIRALRADGHEVTVFCTRVDEHVPADLADLEVRRHRLPKGTGAEREQAVATAAGEIAAAITAGGFDLAYERYSLFSDALARLADPAVGPPVPGILEVNAPLIEEQRRHRHLHDESAALGATRAQLQAAQVVSCVSPAVAAWSCGQGAEPDRVVVTPNGVNTARITPRPHRGTDLGTASTRDIADTADSADTADIAGTARTADIAGTADEADAPVTVGFVGTLKPWHGTDLLLRALARTHGDLRLDICGTGPQQEELEQLAAELGIADRVLLRGAVAPELVPAVLHGLDIAVAPYPAGEHYFSPLKVYEYLAAGLPVVASAIGTIPEVLRDGELGMLVEPGDIDALAAALDTLAADPARRDRLGRAAREAALAEHDWRSRCRGLLARMEVTVR